MYCTRKAKIKWQCRRGMLELDLLLEQFINHSFDTLTNQQLTALEQLLTVSDPILYSWLVGSDNPMEPEIIALVKRIKLSNYVR